MNTILLISYIGYIVSLCIGFLIKKNKKDSLNERYHIFKPYLSGFITLLFGITTILLVLSIFPHYPLVFITFLGAHTLFIIYFYIKIFNSTRCDKQHVIVIYNFFNIVTLYVCSLQLFNEYIMLFVILIYIYTILEFQFAKFGINKLLLWN